MAFLNQPIKGEAINPDLGFSIELQDKDKTEPIASTLNKGKGRLFNPIKDKDTKPTIS